MRAGSSLAGAWLEGNKPSALILGEEKAPEKCRAWCYRLVSDPPPEEHGRIPLN